MAQRARLAGGASLRLRQALPTGEAGGGKDRHIMPGIAGRLLAAESARMFGDDNPVLADDDVVGNAAKCSQAA